MRAVEPARRPARRARAVAWAVILVAGGCYRSVGLGVVRADAAADASLDAPEDAPPADALEASVDSDDSACAEGRARCGGACVDVRADRNHCGRCDRACGGSGCDRGVCEDQLIVDVATSQDHTCALRRSGEVWCWGWNFSGQLGDGSTRSRTMPRPIRGLRDADGVAAGMYHTCAWQAGGGALWCWGANGLGQLGDGSITPSAVPRQVRGLLNVLAVGLGVDHTCAARRDGGVWCWGGNQYGQLGNGGVDDTLAPGDPIEGLRGVTALGAGHHHTCALQGTAVWCWGMGDAALGRGELESPPLRPERVPDLDDAGMVATGAAHTCAIRRRDNSVWCWGHNGFGQIGDGTNAARSSPVPVSSLANVLQISVAPGGNHTCALDGDGRVRCWGANGCGQLGDGTTEPRTAPVLVAIPQARSIRAGGAHSCAVADGGRGVLCWGENHFGQLGTDDPPGCYPTPRYVQGLFE